MSKPDWKDAPEWANYLAMDNDCEWYWFESEPAWMLAGYWQSNGGRFSCAAQAGEAAVHTKERRP